MSPTEDKTSLPSVSLPRQRRPTKARFDRVLDATLAGLRESVTKDVPAGAARAYWLWGLTGTTPDHDLFTQAIGARQLCRLTVTLLDGLVDDRDWPVLTKLVTTMNVYQLYEIISDNLGIGLALPDAPQRAVLRRFNAAMMSTLEGTAMGPAHLLAPIRAAVGRLSGFAYSLAGPAHARMATAFTGARSRPSIGAIEYGLWPLLVANIIAARAVTERMADLAIGPVLRHGLVNRYAAVTRTIDGEHLPALELAALGAHTILVAPTLSFYVGALGELLHPDPAFAGCVSDGALSEVLWDAAMLVRLLNDIGPQLLTCATAGRRTVWRALRTAYARERPSTLEELLLSDSAPSTVLTRLRKDLRHGEFNVALHRPRLAASMPAALDALATAVDYFATLYALHSGRLATGLAALRRRLEDPRPLELVDRFVRFHEHLYANPYTDATGEYAV